MKLSDKDLKMMLTPIQYEVTQKNGTEPPFANQYWNEKREGIYVDVVSGEPLFSSRDKYDSGCGWPSFTWPIDTDGIREVKDKNIIGLQTEVRSRKADSHLGYLFHDGPPPTRLRYNINSAALRFIPKRDMERKGYGDYLKLFEKRVCDIMYKETVLIEGKETVLKAISIMKKKHVSSLVVHRRSIDDAWGIVTRKDIVNNVVNLGIDPNSVKVFEIMTKPVVTVSPDLAIKYCARLFHQKVIRRAPVFDGNALVGIVSNTDIFNSIEI